MEREATSLPPSTMAARTPVAAAQPAVAAGRLTPEVSVLVVAFNEALSIGPMLQELFACLRGQEFSAEVVLVNDASTDRTLEVANEAWGRFSAEADAATLARLSWTVVSHLQNRGMGAAIKTGTEAARGTFVTFLPGDGQVPPEAVGKLLGMAKHTHAELVLSTYVRREDGALRKVLSTGVRALITLTHGTKLESEGPYLFRRTLLEGAQFPVDTFFLNFAFPLRVTRAGLRVRHVEVPCRPRHAGSSKSANLRTVRRVALDLARMRWEDAKTVARLWVASPARRRS